MKSILLFTVLLLMRIDTSNGKDLLVGSTSYDTRLAWQGDAQYLAIPFKKRVKQLFYADELQQPIKCIIAKDINHSQGSAIVTAGGVGYSYANIRIKSERGGGLNYHIEIYQ